MPTFVVDSRLNTTDRAGSRTKKQVMKTNTYKNLALFTFGNKDAQLNFKSKDCKIVKHLGACESVIDIVNVVRFSKTRQYVNAQIRFLTDEQAKFYLAD